MLLYAPLDDPESPCTRHGAVGPPLCRRRKYWGEDREGGYGRLFREFSQANDEGREELLVRIVIDFSIQ